MGKGVSVGEGSIVDVGISVGNGLGDGVKVGDTGVLVRESGVATSKGVCEEAILLKEQASPNINNRLNNRKKVRRFMIFSSKKILGLCSC